MNIKVSASVVSGEPILVGGVGAVAALSCDGPDSHGTSETLLRKCSSLNCVNRRDKDNQRYCRSCHTAYMRGWRNSKTIERAKSKIQMLVDSIKAQENG